MTFGIAASTAAGLRQNFGTMTKPLHPGQAAMNGVTAAQLAHLGWTADANILEAPDGFCQLYAGANQYNLDDIVKRLGNPYELLATGVRSSNIPAVPLPTVRWTAPSAGAAAPLSAADVVAVECLVGRPTIEVLIHSRRTPAWKASSACNIAWPQPCSISALGCCRFRTESPTPGAQQLFDRVIMRLHPEAQDKGTNGEELPVTVTVTLRDGRTLSAPIQHAKGHPANRSRPSPCRISSRIAPMACWSVRIFAR
jgi:2-methylcitrate dehydratase PrpD